jgi:hyperosmotically inducible periplasmic protein
MKAWIIVTSLLLAFGCDKGGEKTQAQEEAADNTVKNERDRDTSSLTPGDQGGSEADRTTTQEIRQAVMKSEPLSITAKNIKIITIDGVVTLRGPVKSAAEKAEIAQLAQKASGVKKVDNQLEIAAP